MTSLLGDLRIALRSLGKSPGFAAVTILTLAVGIGAATAIFSVVDGVLLHPLPYRQANRIVTVRLGVKPGRGRPAEVAFPPGGYRYLASHNRSYGAFGAYIGFPVSLTLTGNGTPRELHVAEMTPSAFRLLGVAPETGRLPTAEEGIRPEGGAPSGQPAAVLISDRLWKQRYGSDPSVLGRTLTLTGHTATVIGVMPPGFDFPFRHTDAWMPIQLDPASHDFRSGYLVGLGRLRSGATVRSAEGDARRLIGHFGDIGFPASWLGYLDGSARIATVKEGMVGKARRPLLILLGTVGFLVLIACFNVVNLLLVRAEARTRESAVRLALGAGRGRLARPSAHDRERPPLHGRRGGGRGPGVPGRAGAADSWFGASGDSKRCARGSGPSTS